VLFGFYRRADANDPEIYVAGAAAILSEYPPEIVDYVCDPRTGLARKLKRLPTLAEISEACESRMDYARAVASLRKPRIKSGRSSPIQMKLTRPRPLREIGSTSAIGSLPNH
jgi:hypothetical protein